ncbi:hypothetical protein COY16_06075 [Candidatus Roizmanbacteria bacterium CG_4_10_14_0_2_um_filter_39_13]|uniref:Uncharacterized protein n=1 Tax=Candidatus Roizmanbacteria bacterium CG_4_10_14_0_2_um_filter_39_13 TaxID=1974825 RepID=A0A2M7TV82_9BACT|nr:MAG: hypothetical protein COY16_06075 [Candidatus Roizmanbacteria bacterium CG_4_10_14_0_2_um_filter_39_13]
MANKVKVEQLQVGTVYHYGMSVIQSAKLRFDGVNVKFFLWVIPYGRNYRFWDVENNKEVVLVAASVNNSLRELESDE